MDAGGLALVLVICLAGVGGFAVADFRDRMKDLEKRIIDAAARDWRGPF